MKIDNHWEWAKCECGNDTFKIRTHLRNNELYDAVQICSECKKELR